MNYIVSGLERSGTALMMQMLHNGGVPIAYDNGSRPADYNNPKGYYELEGGKIIRKLMDGTFPINDYDGVFIKVTAYGIKFLPSGEYKIIYMVRDIDEVLDSTDKMSGDSSNREEMRPLLSKLNRLTIKLMKERTDINCLIVNHRDVMRNPTGEMVKVSQFLDNTLNVDLAAKAVDPTLYRNVR